MIIKKMFYNKALEYLEHLQPLRRDSHSTKEIKLRVASFIASETKEHD